MTKGAPAGQIDESLLRLDIPEEELEQLATTLAMSMDLNVEAFLLDPENFEKISFSDLTVPRPDTSSDRDSIPIFLKKTLTDFFGQWTNRAYLILGGLFVLMLVLFNPEINSVVLREIHLLPPDQVTPPPTPKPKQTPPPTPTPPPVKQTPTPPPLKPIKLPDKKLNKMKVKLDMQREKREVSSATAKLFVRETSDTAAPDIDATFTTDRASDENVAVNLDNLGAGRKGGGSKDGAPAIAIGGSRRGSTDGGAEVGELNLGGSRKAAAPVATGSKGEWVKVAVAGAIAQYQVKCLNSPGMHIYGNIKIQCSDNRIISVWRRM
jgi:hypothetical protein